MNARHPLGTAFPVIQPPVFDSSVLMPFLRATPSPYAAMALQLVHITNIVVCLLTAYTLLSASASSPLKR